MVPNNNTYVQKLSTVAHNCIAWIRSAPFDCGGTTARAFSIDPKAPELAVRMEASSESCNETSEANGDLMRITPIAVSGQPAASWRTFCFRY